MPILYIVLAVVVALILFLIFKYNGFVTLRIRTQEAWADIDVQLKRRYDLIPNLVSTVKGYATHESTAFEKVSEARSRAMQAGTPTEKGEAENILSGTLKSLFAISEAYPELKANTNFLQLQSELSDTENKIQASRRFYNGNVRDLNTAINMFPGNLIAKMFNFAKMDFFQLEEGSAEKEPVAVKF
ncbi:MAG: LemA family protein [Candidatus Paceibacterota bacterium]